MEVLDSTMSASRPMALFGGVTPTSGVDPEMVYQSNQRMAMLILYFLFPMVASAGFAPPHRNPGMSDFFTVVGLVVLSAYMSFFKPVSFRANVVAHLVFFGLAQIVSLQIIQNGMGIIQLVMALVAGWCVSYGLFGNGKFEPDATRFPIVILAALVVLQYENTLSSVVATFLMIDAFLAVVHANTTVPGTSIVYIAFAGLIDLWIRMSAT